MTTYEIIIGLEVHVQLITKSKMFSACSVPPPNAAPNTYVDPVTLALPGTLPVPNETALAWAVRAAYALGCTVSAQTKFDRKSYFYPDLPKGYQISQYDQPIGHDGELLFSYRDVSQKVHIERLHVEEDTGKLFHPASGDYSLVDFNRAGVPLLEMVTEPDLRSPESAKAFLQELQLIMRYLGISDADMEKGQLRCDANISLRPATAATPEQVERLYPKTEIKNLNSFRSVERALQFEVGRQEQLWEKGTPPTKQSTRGWNEASGQTVAQREKEAVQDYRYFPEPDIPLISFSAVWLKQQRAEVPELPAARRRRFTEAMSFSETDAASLVHDKALANYAEQVVSELREWVQAERPKEQRVTWATHKADLVKLVASWLVHVHAGIRAKQQRSIEDSKITPENFAELLAYLYDKDITKTVAQTVLAEMEVTGNDPSNIIDTKKLWSRASDIDLETVVANVVADHPDVVQDYKKGKTTAAQFLVGQVMKATKGTADAKQALEMIVHKLG